jgi:UDP-N-acetylglucosamine 3-dehydrogenase
MEIGLGLQCTSEAILMPVDVLVVGIGRWGSNHLQALSKIQKRGIIGQLFAWDISQKNRDYAEQLGAIWQFKKRAGMAAIIATPTSTHFEIACELIDSGMHVLIEKPMSETEEEARILMDKSLTGRTVIETGLLLRHHSAVKQSRKIIAEGLVGKVERIHCIRHSTRSVREDESIIDVLAIHYLDLCCHLLHEAEPVRTRGQIDTTKSSLLCRISLEFEPGIEGLCEVSWGAEKEVRKMKISGTEGEIELDFSNHQSFTLNNVIFQLEEQTSPLDAELVSFMLRINNHNLAPNTSGRPALRSVGWKRRLEIHDIKHEDIQQH